MESKRQQLPCRKRNKHVYSLLLPLVFLMVESGKQVLASEDCLKGVSVEDEEISSGVSVSYGGGGELQAKGAKFKENPSQNQIVFETSDLSSTNIKLVSPSLTQTNQLNSNPQSGLLQFTTPSITELLPGSTFEDFKALNQVSTFFRVGADDEEALTCKNPGKCKVNFSWDYTPTLWDVSPADVYYGSRTSLFITARKAADYQGSSQTPLDVTIGDSKLNWDDEDCDIRTTIRRYAQRLSGTVMAEKRSKDVQPQARYRGAGLAIPGPRAQMHCKWDGSECFTTRILPSITEISHSRGYRSGGQELVITGHSLDDDQVTVTVDGVPCEVQCTDENQIICITGEKIEFTDSIPPTVFVGQHGVKRTHKGKTHIVTALEMPHDNEDSYADLYQGFFEAPCSGNYQFHMSCDDKCDFKMSLTDPQNPTNMEELMKPESYTEFRAYQFMDRESNTGTHFSRWVTLEKGTKYYFETTHTEYGGDSHLSVGVEIEPTDGAHNYPIVTKQVMTLGVEQNLVRDTIRVNVTMADDLFFVLMYQDQTTLEYEASNPTRAGCSETEFKQNIKNYYSTRFETEPDVFLSCWDFEDNELTCDVSKDQIKTHLYTIETPRSITGKSVENIQILAVNSTSIVTWEHIQSSNEPLSGFFAIRCFNKDGHYQDTNEMAFSSSQWTVQWALTYYCPFLRDSIDVLQDKNIKFAEDGFKFQIYFNQVDVEYPQFEILNSTQSLLGASPVIVNSMVQRGPNAWLETLPLEMLYTAESEPQVVVHVGDMPAICASNNCGFTYEEPEAVITDFTLGECDFQYASQDMYLTGDSLPQIFLHLKFINHGCEVIMQNLTHIHCTAPECFDTAGDWYPELVTDKGPIPIDKTKTQAHRIQPKIDKVTPSNLNSAGGEVVQITGSGFPTKSKSQPKCNGRNARNNLKDHSPGQKNGQNSNASVKLSDGTDCRIIETSKNQIACVPNPFVTKTEKRATTTPQPIDVQVQVNGLTASQNLVSVNYPNSVVSILPISVSPILVKTLVIQLSDDFTEEQIEQETFSVVIVLRELGNVSENSVIREERPLHVVEKNGVTKTLTVKYGGAYSGLYDVIVTNSQGNLYSEVTLQVILEVTDFSPRQGSQFGGTLVTIQGRHFSDIATDNPVKIGYEYITGTDHYCYVLQTSENEIKCRTAVDFGRQASVTQLIVFAATYEEGECNVEGGCDFEYIDSSILPTLTSAQTLFDEENQTYMIVINGVQITDQDVNLVDIFIGKDAQKVLSVNSTHIVAQMTTIEAGRTALPLEVYLSSGVVNGFNELKAGLTFEPKLLSVDTNIVSIEGSTIRARVSGAGILDNLTLVERGGTTSLCQRATMIEYGTLECETIAQVIIPTQLGVFDFNSGLTFDCQVADMSVCQLQTFSEESQPSITQYELTSSSTIKVTGKNLALNDFDSCELTFASALADSCTILSDTEISAEFVLGVPGNKAEELGTLVLVHQNGFAKQVVQNPVLNQVDLATGEVIKVGIENILTYSAQTEGQICSLNGGCLHEVTSQGLASAIKTGKAQIKVCEKPCALREDLSSDSQAVCALPQLETTQSVGLFEITKSGKIHGAHQSGFPEYLSQVWDNENLPGLEFSEANCWAQFDYTPGFVGILEEFKLFMDTFNDKTTYDGRLKLQGSNDKFNSEIEDIIVIGSEIHEGWNYYDLKEQGQTPMFASYRIFNDNANGCLAIGEVALIGKEVVDTIESNHQCQVTVEFAGETDATLSQNVVYSVSQTPILSNISPRFGSVEGNTQITFTGDWPSLELSDYTIEIDDLQCNLISVSASELLCVTVPRSGTYSLEPKLQIFVEGYGRVATQNKLFRYVSLWSQYSTWGGLFPPVDGESVAVGQGLHLLVDIDHSPKLNAVIIDGGSLIFPSNDENHDHHRTFDAHYIYVQNGLIEVGTEEEPYMSKLTITMHGNITDPQIPIYGNKCIAVRQGTLDLHGRKRDVTWTKLETTVHPGDTQITLTESVDWIVGEVIVVASTGFDHREAEQRTIIEIVSGDKPVVTLDQPFKYQHYSAVDNYGDSDFIEMRAEVGLLSRNVVFQGDVETSQNNLYGAQIILLSQEADSSIGRIENVELVNVGQAYQKGRYPIYFSMLGNVNSSYVQGNAIHHSFNRGTAIHGVHHLLLERNVYYDIMGHCVYMQDAIETKNIIRNNLVISTSASTSLQNTDFTPASFYITNPDNIVTGNVAAGSERFGFWYDLYETSTGASFDPNICPSRTQLGEFRENIAHSSQDYGLRIFSGFDPREFPCLPNVFNDTAYEYGDNYYEGNNPVQATFENFLTYKNGKNGLIAEGLGAVVFKNIKAADNKVAGVEVTTLEGVRDGMSWIEDAVIVGRTIDNEEHTGSPYGIITPQRDGWAVNNVRFYNLNFNNSAALGSCSKCYCRQKTDSDCRTVDFQQLFFDETVQKKIKYQYPYKGIFHDLDGTLTGLGPDTWATPYWKHNEQAPECQVDMEIFDGLLCNSTIQVRRLVLDNYEPSSLSRKVLYMTQYDDININQMDAATFSEYLKDLNNFSSVQWRDLANPNNHWAVPMVTGHKYYFRWDFGLDFTKMGVERVHWLWKQTDKNLQIAANHYDIRAGVEILDNNQELHLNNTIGSAQNVANLRMGDNLIQNQTSTRLINFIVNGFQYNISRIDMTAFRCYGPCVSATNKPLETNVRYWSNPDAWGELGRIPEEGDDVVVESGWNMIYDIEESPILSSLQIQGQLTFLNNGTDRTLSVYNLWVRSGILQIGNETHPFTSKARIVLQGDYREKYWAFTNGIEAGNKNFVVTGTANLFGAPRDSRTRLRQTLLAGHSETVVESGLDWIEGERVVIAATNMRSMDTDVLTIKSYDATTGKIVFSEKAKGFHFGDFSSTESDYQVDMRAEVSMLNRTIMIEASTHDKYSLNELTSSNRAIDVKILEVWGCRILVSDFFESDFTHQTGSLIMDNVQVYNCSQRSTYKAALQFENAAGSGSRITNCALSEGQGLGVYIKNSANITFQDNIIADFVLHAIWAKNSQKLTFEKNWIFKVIPDINQRPGFEFFGHRTGCFNAQQGLQDIRVSQNVVAGCWYFGYYFTPETCDAKNPSYVFENNIAHSISGYGAIASSIKRKCTEVKDFIAYKVSQASIMLGSPSATNRGRRIVSIDTRYGAAIHPSSGVSELYDSYSYAEHSGNMDCPVGSLCDHCIPRAGLIAALARDSGHSVDIDESKYFPLFSGGESMTGHGYVYDHKFVGYNELTTTCGSLQRAIMPHQEPNYTPYFQIIRPTFIDLNPDALAMFSNPDPDWAIIEDCGDFPCTGPENILIRIEKARFSFGRLLNGIVENNQRDLRSIPADFVLASNNNQSVSTQVFDTCQFETNWNGYLCSDYNMGLLVIDSLDEDTFDRSVQPLYVTNNLNGFSNKLNSFMDQCSDGSYSCQKRRSRFPTIVNQDYDEYVIEYTGTPPESQEFRLWGKYPSKGILLTINYPKSGSYQLFDGDNQAVMATDWDDNTKTWAKPTGKYCGEFRFEGVINRLQFWLEPYCKLVVKPRDAIQLQIRMEFSLQEFYQKGGVTTFIDRMAFVLGIHKADIKIVAVYQGSTIVEFLVLQEVAEEQSTVSGPQVKEAFSKFIKSSREFMGSPILDAKFDEDPVEIDKTGDLFSKDINGEDGQDENQGKVNIIDQFKAKIEQVTLQQEKEKKERQKQEDLLKAEMNKQQQVLNQVTLSLDDSEMEENQGVKRFITIGIISFVVVAIITVLILAYLRMKKFQIKRRGKEEKQVCQNESSFVSQQASQIKQNNDHTFDAQAKQMPKERRSDMKLLYSIRGQTGSVSHIPPQRMVSDIKVTSKKISADGFFMASSKMRRTGVVPEMIFNDMSLETGTQQTEMTKVRSHQSSEALPFYASKRVSIMENLSAGVEKSSPVKKSSIRTISVREESPEPKREKRISSSSLTIFENPNKSVKQQTNPSELDKNKIIYMPELEELDELDENPNETDRSVSVVSEKSSTN